MNELYFACLISLFDTRHNYTFFDTRHNYKLHLASKFMLCNIPIQHYLKNGLYFASSDVTVE